jgi:hypothetical protein
LRSYIFPVVPAVKKVQKAEKLKYSSKCLRIPETKDAKAKVETEKPLQGEAQDIVTKERRPGGVTLLG